MKKLILILSIVTLSFSCSSSDDNNNDSSSQITPPAWIQGTWLLESPLNTGAGFRFLNDDFCIITTASSQSCYKEQINLFEDDIYTNVEQEITDNVYFLEVTIGPTIQSFDFEKISDTEIRWLAVPTAVYVKQ